MPFLQNYLCLLKNNLSLGLDIETLPDGSPVYHACLLEKRKGKIEVLALQTNLRSIQEIKAPKDIPVFVSFNGKGTLHKKVEFSPEADQSHYLGFLPGDASYKDFYMQLSPLYGNYHYVSVARRAGIDTVLTSLAEIFNIISCSLGPFAIHTILAALAQDKSFYELQLPGLQLSISKSQVLDCSLVNASQDIRNKEIMLDGQPLSTLSLVPFAAALQYFTADSYVQINDPVLSQYPFGFSQKRRYKLVAPAAIVFIAVFSLSFLVLKTHLQTKQEALLQNISFHQKDWQEYSSLAELYNNRKNFIVNNGLGQMSKSSYYIDRLLKDVPEEIQLNTLAYCPAKKSAYNDSIVEYKEKTITMSGVCNNSVALNEWIKIIKEQPFIGSVSIKNYKQDRARSKGEFLFIVIIK